jgi:hypothetical protein
MRSGRNEERVKGKEGVMRFEEGARKLGRGWEDVAGRNKIGARNEQLGYEGMDKVGRSTRMENEEA